MVYSSLQFNYYGFDKEIIYLILVVKFFSLLLELAHSILVVKGYNYPPRVVAELGLFWTV
jgi:hypothetical protein